MRPCLKTKQTKNAKKSRGENNFLAWLFYQIYFPSQGSYSSNESWISSSDVEALCLLLPSLFIKTSDYWNWQDGEKIKGWKMPCWYSGGLWDEDLAVFQWQQQTSEPPFISICTFTDKCLWVWLLKTGNPCEQAVSRNCQQTRGPQTEHHKIIAGAVKQGMEVQTVINKGIERKKK